MRLKHILMTGLPRSGTTFTSHILLKSNSLVYLPEPFNINYGLPGVDCRFPTIRSEDSKDKYARLVDDLFSFRASYKKNYSKDGNLKKIVKFFFGSRANTRYILSGMFRKDSSRFLIKDPDAAFLSEYMSERYNCKVMVLIRHPGAIMASFKRLGWTFDFTNFLMREEFVNKYLSEFKQLLQRKDKSLAVQVGLLWVCVYKVLTVYEKRHCTWLTIKHEDICLKPEETFEKIFEWGDLKYTNSIRKEIIAKMKSDNPINALNNSIHDLSRNSQKLVDYWKHNITHEEKTILKKITAPIAQLYYDETTWS
jgi:hypothetical protein